MSQPAASQPLSLGASIVLYRTHVSKIAALIEEMLAQGVARVYLIDNSPSDFDSFSGWPVPTQVTIQRLARNVGYGGGHNVAIRESIKAHKYHLVSNPDIRLGPGALPALCALLEGQPDIGVAMPEVVGPDGERHYLCKRAPSPLDFMSPRILPKRWRERRRAHYEMRDHDYERMMEPELLSGCFMFFRSRTLQQTGAFDDRFFMYLEDFDLCRRARAFGRNVYYPAVRIVHEHQRGHRRSRRLLLAFAMSALRYFSKWGWFESAASREGARKRRP